MPLLKPRLMVKKEEGVNCDHAGFESNFLREKMRKEINAT
jgi:hypothetical protein